MVKNGRYGPYVSHNGINATITGDRTPETITLTEAVVLLDARAASSLARSRGARPAAKKPGAPARKRRKRPPRTEGGRNKTDTAEENRQAAQEAGEKDCAKITAAE